MSAFCKLYGRYSDLIHNYKRSLSHMVSNIFHSNCQTALDTLTFTTDNSAFTIMELGSRRVRPVGRGRLLLLGTWSNLRYFWGSVLAHLFIWLEIPTWILRLITLRYFNYFIYNYWILIQACDSEKMKTYKSFDSYNYSKSSFVAKFFISHENVCYILWRLQRILYRRDRYNSES
jgi:hypothetical protein